MHAPISVTRPAKIANAPIGIAPNHNGGLYLFRGCMDYDYIAIGGVRKSPLNFKSALTHT